MRDSNGFRKDILDVPACVGNSYRGWIIGELDLFELHQRGFLMATQNGKFGKLKTLKSFLKNFLPSF